MMYLAWLLPLAIAPALAAWWMASHSTDSTRRHEWLALTGPTHDRTARALALLKITRLAVSGNMDPRRAAGTLRGAGVQLDSLAHRHRLSGSRLGWRLSMLVYALWLAPGVVAWTLTMLARKNVDPFDGLLDTLGPLLEEPSAAQRALLVARSGAPLDDVLCAMEVALDGALDPPIGVAAREARSPRDPSDSSWRLR